MDLQVTHNYCWSWQQIRSFYDLLTLRFDYLLQWLMDLQKHLCLSMSYRINEMIQKDSQINRYIGWGLGGSQTQDLLSPCSGGVHVLKSKMLSRKCDVQRKIYALFPCIFLLKSITWKGIYLCLGYSIILLQNFKDIVLF